MATNLNLVRTLTLRAKTEGVDEAASSMKKLAGAGDEVAASSVKVERATLSAESALQKLQRRVDSEFRAQQDMAKALETLNRARQQGLISQARQNELMQMSLRYHNGAAQAAGAHARAMQELSSRATGAASQLGSMGAIISALGPAGLAVAAGLGALALGFKAAADAALHLGERAGQLRDLSETIGFTVESLQALEIAAGRTGVSSEQLSGNMEKFSASLSEIREQSGKAFESLERINPALARQAAGAETAEDAFRAISEAIAEASLEDANFAAKSIFGKGGIGMVRVIKEMQGDLEGFTAAMRDSTVISGEMAERMDNAFDAIHENMKLAGELVESIFAEAVLDQLQKFSEFILEAAHSFKDLADEMSQIDWGEIVSGMQSVLDKLAAWLPLLRAAQLAWAGIRAAMSGLMGVLPEVPGTGSPGGLPSGGPAELPGTGSPAGLPDPTTLERKYKDLSKAVKGAGKEALDFNDIMKANVSALGNAATEAEKYEVKMAELAKQLQEGTISQDTFNRAASQLSPGVVALKDVTSDLGKALASAFITGADAAEALNRALQSVATTAASKGIDKLITGFTGGGFDLPSIATSGIIAIGATIPGKLFGSGEELTASNVVRFRSIAKPDKPKGRFGSVTKTDKPKRSEQGKRSAA